MPPTAQSICLVGDIDPPLGGVATYCRNLSESLAGQGWTVSLVDTSGGTGKMVPTGLSSFYSASPREQLLYALDPRAHRARSLVSELVSTLSPRDRLRFAALTGSLSSILRRSPAHLVHSNHAGLRSLAALAVAESARLPLVLTIHGAEFTSPALESYQPLARELCRRATAVLANSEFTAEAARRTGVTQPITVTLLGVDISRFSPGPVPPEFFQRYDLDPGKRRILFSGWLSHNKGVDVLLDAVGRLDPGLREGLECVCVGPDEGTLDDLNQRAAREKIGRIRVLSRSRPEDFPVFYRSAEIFVLPTRVYEGFGLVALEALASGCAVVASNLGGIPEAMDGAGLVFEPGNAEQLSEILSRLLLQPEELARRRRVGPQVAGRFSWERPSPRVLRQNLAAG